MTAETATEAHEKAVTAAAVAQEADAAARQLSQTVDKLMDSKFKLHKRCLDLFTELSAAQARLAELESIVSAMKYAAIYASKESAAAQLIDLQQCTVCAIESSSDV